MHTRYKRTTFACRNTHASHTGAPTALCPLNTNRKYNIRHTPYTITHHTSPSKAKTQFSTTAATQSLTNFFTHLLHHTLTALKRYFHTYLVPPFSHSEQINHSLSNHTYTHLTSNRIHHLYVPFELSHTHHPFNFTHVDYIRNTLSPWI